MNDNRYHRRLYFFCCFLIACSFLSCALRKKGPVIKEPEIQWDTKTSDQILDELRNRKHQITDLTAAFSLSVDPPPSGQPSSINGVIFFARRPEGPCVRIKGLGFFGRVLFDLVQTGDTLRIYVPSRHTLYRGRTGKGEMAGNVWGDLFATMFADFSGESVPRASRPAVRDDTVILPLVDGEIRIGRRTGLVRQWRLRKKIITYDHYDHRPGWPPVPMRIEVSTEDGARHALCRLSQVNINSDIGNVFDLSGYNPKSVRPLDELGGTSR